MLLIPIPVPYSNLALVTFSILILVSAIDSALRFAFYLAFARDHLDEDKTPLSVVRWRALRGARASDWPSI
ncbi:hypothetical protein EVAR_7181_1 [Eumeta japonica]|uniref:Uncharacterized protein n=1 Tax=Eumeta variegata TaxID=151549 RepID=A0A4C1U7S3_EUMVA|nr:hypothetical protein EVAR_7181_1 [Eumeta japonica]